MKSITIDQRSAEAAAAGQIPLVDIIESKFQQLPENSNKTKFSKFGENFYVLSKESRLTEGLLIISLEEDGPLSGLSEIARATALARILRCATMIFTGRTSFIPIAWRPYHFNNRVAFQAATRHLSANTGEESRILIDVSQDVGPRVFAFCQDRKGTQDISEFNPDFNLLKDALKYATEAANIATDNKQTTPETLGSNIFIEGHTAELNTYSSFEDWYNAKLTINQRKFVDHEFSSSVRLVGPAGSGKTVTLAIKCLRELRRSNAENLGLRLLFLTHASSTASDIENLMLGMDQITTLDALTSNPPALVITTLYSLANSHMRYNLRELTPISLDGYEGRLFQAEILNSIITAETESDWITYRSSCSIPFVSYMEADEDSIERRFFLWELLNEFACVLDAEGVRRGQDRRVKYLTEKRKSWMMPLDSKEEREVVLRLYDKFGSWLRETKAIGGDQMIADFVNDLDSYRWEATRHKEGFSAIFVDELHLFNRQERMLFTYLLRNPSTPPSVFMAYDAKQSPRDTFLGLSNSETQKYDLWRDARLGKSDKIELVDVFRYTPQIARVLSMIDQSFPGQDLDGDWPKYSGISQTKDGPLPIFAEFPNVATTYGIAFKRARSIQAKLEKGERVAVLCCSQDLFQTYLDYKDLRDSFLAITSREEALDLSYSKRKFIFSMPEFVAGLQYHTVLLIDANRSEVPEGPYAIAALRKFVSQVYLGASRAERILEIYSNKEYGGMPPLLSLPVLESAIQKIDFQSIKVS